MDELQAEAITLLAEIWQHFETRHICPRVKIRRQRSTGQYVSDYHQIELRQDCWIKMPLAERRLVMIHEALHATGMPHKTGFRTAWDTASHLVYWSIWGHDEAWRSFEMQLREMLPLKTGSRST